MNITDKKDIKAIYFDQGGVVMGARIPLPDEGEANLNKIMNMTGIKEDFRELKKGFLQVKIIIKMGMDSLIECTADKVWPQWMLPEVPKEILIPIAEELTLLHFESKGRRTADPNIREVLITLKNGDILPA